MNHEHDCTCIICGEQKPEGIVIITQFICESCEAEMVQTDVEDVKYSFFIHRLKRLWVTHNA